MKQYNFIGHHCGTFNRKNYQIKIPSYFSRIFRENKLKSVILTPGKEIYQETGNKAATPGRELTEEFNVLNIYPDFFKMLRHGRTLEEKSKFREAELRNYNSFIIPTDLREHIEYFGSGEETEEVLIKALLPSFLQVWDKGTANYIEKTYPITDENMESVANTLIKLWKEREKLKKSGVKLF